MRCRRPLALTPVVLLTAVVVALALLAADCGGGGGSPRVAGVASTTPAAATPTTTPTNAATRGLLAFSQCMRSHGLPDFPDPQRFVGGNVKLTIHELAPSPAALSACEQFLPTTGGKSPQQTAAQQRTQLADALSFARCMRGHGMSRFPDPTAQGQLTVEMVQAQGIDVHSPAFLQIVQTCLPASHGGLTPAKVRASLANASG
jgi:hypothetical protein